jgi:hypothetical protein
MRVVVAAVQRHDGIGSVRNLEHLICHSFSQTIAHLALLLRAQIPLALRAVVHRKVTTDPH